VGQSKKDWRRAGEWIPGEVDALQKSALGDGQRERREVVIGEANIDNALEREEVFLGEG
jgi:hypothetical protein